MEKPSAYVKCRVFEINRNLQELSNTNVLHFRAVDHLKLAIRARSCAERAQVGRVQGELQHQSAKAAPIQEHSSAASGQRTRVLPVIGAADGPRLDDVQAWRGSEGRAVFYGPGAATIVLTFRTCRFDCAGVSPRQGSGSYKTEIIEGQSQTGEFA